MKNITATINADTNTLTLQIDLSTQIGESKSGKNILIATTSGNAKLPNGITIGVNVYKPK